VRWTSWRWVRLLGGVVVLGVVVHRWGAGPFLDALRDVDVRLLMLATGIAAMTTLCAAWRWKLVARGLGAALPLSTAVASCYRSQVLNSTLPGGVLGDVHRGVVHGRDVGDIGRGLRAVWWERSGGQVVQAALTVTALLLLPSPLRPSMTAVLSGIVGLGVVGVLLRRAARRHGPTAWTSFVRSVADDVRHGLLASGAWPGIVAASVVVVAGHVATFVIAAHAAGSSAPLTTLVPVALLVLVASGVPTNVAGWGPREGAAAWVFSAAGMGAAAGLRASAVYGILALVATLPGAAVLVVDVLHRRHSVPRLVLTKPAPAPLEYVTRG
jgi:glycosyltransferase 2 family protein